MSNKKEIFSVQGMTCISCEAKVEKKLRSLAGVAEAKVSFAKNQATVLYDPEQLNFEQMQAAVLQAGYSLGKSQTKHSNKPASGEDKPFSIIQFIGIAVVLLSIYLLINNTVGFRFMPEITSSMGYGVLFLVGLLTSLHCVAMCGGINLSQCITSRSGAATGAKSKPSLLYNLGRVTSYTILGGIIGALGSVISFSGWARGMVAIFSGLFMIVMGLSMTGLFPWVNKITPRLPRIFREKVGSASRGKGPYLVGLLNGLMPCGPLQAMQLYALGTGSFLAGALSMFFFSLGTLPLMFGLGAVITMLGSKFTKNMLKVSAVLVAVLGIVMLSRGLALSGISLPSLSSPADNAPSATTAIVSTEGDVQKITSDLPASGYPDITVQKGVPVVWNLRADASTLNSCNETLVIPAYDIQITLKVGDNLIEFTPTDSGTIPYSCWMGMQTGTIFVVDDLKNQTAPSVSDTSAQASTGSSGGFSCCSGNRFFQ